MFRTLFKYCIYLAVFTAVLMSLVVYMGYRYYTYDLPDFKNNISGYRPKLINEVYSSEGILLAEFYSENRRLVPLSDIPEHVINAFIAVEDRRFYEHQGIDLMGIMAAFIANLKEGEIIRGGSTITQQVTKNIVLSPERSFSRKIKEAILAYRIEKNLSKDEILYLYLNHIYLGDGTYGVDAASRDYFGKPVHDINVSEAALLAGLPKRPEYYNPRKDLERAMERQRTVLSILKETDYLNDEQYEKAVNQEIKIVDKRNSSDVVAPYFVEYIRKYIEDKFGTQDFLNGGYKVFTTLDTKLNIKAQLSVRNGILDLERRRGRGELIKHIGSDEFKKYLSSPDNKPIDPDNIGAALVIKVEKSENNNLYKAYLRAGNSDYIINYVKSDMLKPEIANNKYGEPELINYAPLNNHDIDVLYRDLKPGDVININVLRYDKEKQFYISKLYYKPEAQAALFSIDTNGFVRSMVGGFNFEQSQFNRAVQAKRQPGSSFKPILYSSALDKGYTATTIVYDLPVVMKEWSPDNYDEDYLGPIILKKALAKSRNLASIRLILDLSPRYVVDYAKKFRFESKLNPYPSLALGGSETTLMEMVKAFNVFANGGRYIEPKFIYRIYDREGKIVEDNTEGLFFTKKEAEEASRNSKRNNIIKDIAKDLGRYDDVKNSDNYLVEKKLTSKVYTDELAKYEAPGQFLDLMRKSTEIPFVNSSMGEQAISPETAYIMNFMLQGVVNEGTAVRAKYLNSKAPIGGKTGTTNDFTDALFIGFSPKIVTGVWVGRDNHLSLGKKEAGSRAALPIWMDYMDVALDKYPGGEFEVPQGIKYIATAYGNIPYNVSTYANNKSEYYIEQAIGYNDRNILENNTNESETEADLLMRH